MRVLNAGQMQEADRLTIDDLGIPSIVLMENAGRAVVHELTTRFRGLAFEQTAILIPCAPACSKDRIKRGESIADEVVQE